MRIKNFLIGVGIVGICIAGFYGCNQEPTGATSESSGRSFSYYTSWENIENLTTGPDASGARTYAMYEMVTLEPDRTTAIAGMNGDQQVTFAHQWLSQQNYSYVDTNSVVFVIHRISFVPASDYDPDLEVSLQKATPLDSMVRVIHEDTIVWQSFANPTHDMGMHTGVATAWRDSGPKQTVLAEMDISDSLPQPIREGRFVDEEFIPGDVGLNKFTECLGEGVGGAIVGCALTNGAYLECVGAGAVGSAIVCGAISLWGWLSGD